jgi:phytoene/squalene synthetase
MSRDTGLALYGGTASVACGPVIRRYSSSFRLATGLFPRRCRAAITAVYALVRIADEIVDGTAGEAGLDRAAQRRLLDELEDETVRAVAIGFSSNLVVHAFATVARDCAIEPALTGAFFASMRRDLDDVAFDDAEYRHYVHGSAEVVGLMCLRVFLAGRPADPAVGAALDAGAARLGAAFQKVNFLRDLGDDRRRLGRAYLPGSGGGLTDEAKAAVVADVRADLRAARAVVRHLPGDCRRAVLVATAIFGELLRRIDRLPADRLTQVRVSVPAPVKVALAVRWSLVPGAAA